MELYRSIATVLFTDIVGSTERADELGDLAWRELLEHHNRLVRKELRRFQGREVSTSGDSFLAIFEGPGQAILCAWNILKAVREVGLEVRCGLHMGEVERTSEGDVGGIAVNIAARVSSLAGQGEILVSSTVRDAERGSGFAFEDKGLRELKGLKGAWQLHAVTGVPDNVPFLRHSSLLPSLFRRRRVKVFVSLAMILGLAGLYAMVRQPGRDLGLEVAVAEGSYPGIAVLPFSVRGRGLDIWREGAVDLLSTNIDGVGGLRAIASRTVLARWRDRLGDGISADLPTMLGIATDSGALYGLVGTVVSTDQKTRLVAELYDLESGESLGQVSEEGPPDSIFGLVDGLSVQIIDRMRQVENVEIPNFDLASQTTASLPALRAYLEGESRFRRSEFDDAIPYYEMAVEADSSFALAWARLSEAHGWLEAGRPEAQEAYQRAEAFADRLPPRERDLLEVELALFVHSDPEATERARDAVIAYPDQPEAWHNLGEAYFHSPEQSLASREDQDEAFDRALRLDPLYAPAHIHPIDNGFYYADSVALTRRLERFREFAGGSVYDDRYRIVYDLAFGGPATRDSVLEALDLVPTVELLDIVIHLGHPRFLGIQTEVADRLAARPDAPPQATAMLRLYNRFARGRISDFLLLLEDPNLEVGARLNALLAAYSLEVPISPLVFQREFTFNSSDTVPNARHIAAGIYAIDQANWSHLEKILEAYRPMPGRLRAEGDSTSAASVERDLSIIEAWRAMESGRYREALPTLEAAYRDGATPASLAGIVEIYRRLDQPEDALAYARMYPPNAWLGLQIGDLNERVGNIEQALRAYEWVLLAFVDADPEVQPLVDVARQAINRLQGLRQP